MSYFRYILLSSACLTLSYAIFLLLYRKDTGFRQQRVFLIISALFSSILPFSGIVIAIPSGSNINIPASSLAGPSDLPDMILNTAKGPDLSVFYNILTYIYTGVAVFLILTAFVQAFRIMILIRSGLKERHGNFVVCCSENISAPFSFLKWIFIPAGITDQTEIQNIIAHERVHSYQMHSIDMLMAELICAAMWFNPVAWMFRKTISLTHEYLADEGTIESGTDILRYQMQLVNQVTEDKLLYIQSGFNNKQLKKRIIMMTKTKNQVSRRVRILNFISLPAILIVAMALINGFFPADAKAQKQEVKKESKQDQKEVTVVGYGKPSSVKDQKGKSDKKDDLKEVTVVGYSNQEQKEKGSAADTVNYILDGVRVTSISDINPDSIASVNVLKQDRIIIIRTKSYDRKLRKLSPNNESITITSKNPMPENLMYIIDGKTVSEAELKKMNPENVESVSVLKGREEVKRYSNEDHDGVIIITTKKP